MKAVELASEQEGYAHMAVADHSSVTLASLRGAVAKTPFQLDDVEWPVARADAKGSRRAP